MTEWKPIETAPRDGTPVLLFVPGMRSWNRKNGMPDVVVGLWESHHAISRGGGPFETGSWFSDVGDVDQGYESTGAYFEHEALRPTHWTELPALPTD